ncbi:MAG: deoxyribodipyrimidine photo-lyase [Bacteroidota bacterium]
MAIIIPQEIKENISEQEIAIFWFRRDLRLFDNAGLYHALCNKLPILPLFIFDSNILSDLEEKNDARVEFIHHALKQINEQIIALNKGLLVTYGDPEEVWARLVDDLNIKAVYTNHDFEPYAIQRDSAIRELLSHRNISFYTFKDHVLFEKAEVVKDNGEPYTVFTPYSRKWKNKLMSGVPENQMPDLAKSKYLQAFPSEDHIDNFLTVGPVSMPSLFDIGFEKSGIDFPPSLVKRGLIKNYGQTRNFPAINGTSKLGIHFRFGTISIREKARNAIGLSDTYLNELIWRDFYAMILSWFPHVVGNPFRKKYELIEWRNNEKEFEAWCAGKTGFPIVDAGMRELNTTGYMHNRVRMIVASFLTKHLLIDWRWGEAYFAKKLLDFDLASNNGGWQWAAGCGTDAAPYFRVFNPYSQQTKFDKEFQYIKKWVPEYGSSDYPDPVVNHKAARERCLRVYKEGLDKASV